MKIRLGLLVAILLLVSHTALPEIEKVGRVCGNGICPAWWPNSPWCKSRFVGKNI